jgi:hypothetical protein
MKVLIGLFAMTSMVYVFVIIVTKIVAIKKKYLPAKEKKLTVEKELDKILEEIDFHINKEEKLVSELGTLTSTKPRVMFVEKAEEILGKTTSIVSRRLEFYKKIREEVESLSHDHRESLRSLKWFENLKTLTEKNQTLNVTFDDVKNRLEMQKHITDEFKYLLHLAESREVKESLLILNEMTNLMEGDLTIYRSQLSNVKLKLKEEQNYV